MDDDHKKTISNLFKFLWELLDKMQIQPLNANGLKQ